MQGKETSNKIHLKGLLGGLHAEIKRGKTRILGHLGGMLTGSRQRLKLGGSISANLHGGKGNNQCSSEHSSDGGQGERSLGRGSRGRRLVKGGIVRVRSHHVLRKRAQVLDTNVGEADKSGLLGVQQRGSGVASSGDLSSRVLEQVVHELAAQRILQSGHKRSNVLHNGGINIVSLGRHSHAKGNLQTSGGLFIAVQGNRQH
mmetsp:Transcript_11030/g.18005  ORF Transcript_11030/g.18005 Transcript_11030/m.18005 type:complete len:202 (-) Transcript_11030:3087-3692(-)